MSEKESPAMKALRIVYNDEVIIAQCVPCQVVKGRVLIEVHPDCRVVASVSPETAEQGVLPTLKKKSRWICQRLREFRGQQIRIAPCQFVSGKSHHYLGKQYQLKVTEGASAPQRVKMLRGRLEVMIRHKSTEKVKALLAEWYRKCAKDIFQRRLDLLIPQALWVSERPPIRLRAMQTQWGNCPAKGYLTLNPWLAKVSSECIDYVLLHKLCHVAEHNHGEELYCLTGQVIPDWEKVKEQLDGVAGTLLVGA